MIYAVVVLIILHALDGRELSVNPDQVTSLHAAKDSEGDSNKVIAKGVRCLISTSDGKNLSVVETCEMVRHMINQAKE